jgi:antitoxin FitA
MAAITIRQLDENVKSRLRIRAAHHGRSMEEEAREILRAALGGATSVHGNLAERIRQRFEPFGGMELKLPRRDPIRKPPDFARDRPGK